MKTCNYKNWFDSRDLETPYKAIGRAINAKGESIMQVIRFADYEDALRFFAQCQGRCIVSHHNYAKKKTKIIAYKFT